MLYKTNVRPHLDFFASAWNPHNIVDIEDLESVQRRATKLIPCLKPLENSQQLKEIGIQSLKDRRRRGDLIQYNKKHHNLNHVKWISRNELVPELAVECPAKGLRVEKQRAQTPIVKNCLPRDNFLTNSILPDLNILPDHIIIASSVNSFKK